jgi:hypothetical protein
MVIVGRIALPLGRGRKAVGVAAGDRPMRPCSTRGRCGRHSGRQAQCHHRRARGHGDREFSTYREDHTDPHTRWVGRGFPEPSRQTLMRLHRVERIAPPKPFGAAPCGSSTAGAHPPSARTVSHAWRAPARALAAVRGLRLYPYTGSSSKPGFCSGPTKKKVRTAVLNQPAGSGCRGAGRAQRKRARSSAG